MGKQRAEIGLIGCGGISRTHLPNILSCDRVHLRAAADLDEQRLKDFEAESGCDYVTNDAAKIFADENIDGVMILTSNDTHAPLTIAALQAGKHVFVEKPMALTAAESEEIIAVSEKAGKKVMVGFWYVIHPAFKAVCEKIPNPYMISARCAAGANGENFDPANAFSSVMKPAKGFGAGGSMIHQGCYLLDTALLFARSKPVQISAFAPDDDVYNNMMVSVRFESGAVAQILNSNIGGGRVLEGKWYFEVIGGKVNAAIENLKKVVFEGLCTDTLEFDYHAGFRDEPGRFAEVILDGAEPPVGARQAGTISLLTEAAFHSVKTGSTVTADQMRLSF